jgi:outer membrane protein OmpA-like peptidoglycan-associated protein
MKTIGSIGLVVVMTGISGILGCAATMPPQDLVSARTAYDRANRGPAPQYNPADLHAAKEQLDVAEAAFVEEGDTQNTRDQAYVAIRKTELAEAVARTKRANQAAEGVVDAMHDDQKKTVARTAAELGQTKAQVAAQGVALVAQGAALQDEKARREEAEKRAAQAAADLAAFASVKQEARGMVITLSGSVLFASAKWDLLPAAQMKLNDVANALIKEDPISKIVVEGHTDSQGSASSNQDLSQRRAQVVRDYLVTRGIASDRSPRKASAPRVRLRTTRRRKAARTIGVSKSSSRQRAPSPRGKPTIASLRAGAESHLRFRARAPQVNGFCSRSPMAPVAFTVRSSGFRRPAALSCPLDLPPVPDAGRGRAGARDGDPPKTSDGWDSFPRVWKSAPTLRRAAT